MEIYRAVAGRQVIIPIVSTDVSAATGTFTVSSNPADDFDVVVDGVTVTVTRAGTAAATTDAIASAITSAISATTITSIATAVSDGTSVVTLTAAANGRVEHMYALAGQPASYFLGYLRTDSAHIDDQGARLGRVQNAIIPQYNLFNIGRVADTNDDDV